METRNKRVHPVNKKTELFDYVILGDNNQWYGTGKESSLKEAKEHIAEIKRTYDRDVACADFTELYIYKTTGEPITFKK